MTNAKTVFTEIFQKNSWGCAETVSGHGSTKYWSEFVVKRLEVLMQLLNVKTFADVPCGDCNFISGANLEHIKYTGYEIVPELINSNRRKFYGRKNMRFKLVDIITEIIEPADLIFCRDTILHIPNPQIIEMLKNFKKSGSKWLVITHNIAEPGWDEKINSEIKMGDFRPVDLTRAPFNLPLPLLIILEGFAYRGLGLWDLESLNLTEHES